MRKAAGWKKAMASLVSAATLFSCTITGTMNFSTVTAADGANYAEALAMSLYFFDANECGTEVDDNCLTWRGNCHTYDAQASLDSAKGLSSSSKSFIQSANGGSNTVDVSGGYHDAGDHIKFNKTMGFAMTSLAWSYYSHPNAYDKTDSTDHLKYILKKNADYLMKVTYLNGNDVVAFCYMVGDEGTDHSVWSSPESQNMTRNTYWADSSHPDGCTAGWMSSCLAATSIVLKDSAPDYAKECLKYANSLEAFAKKYPSCASDGYGSMYQNSNDAYDEIAFAELWCAIANNGGTLPASYNPTYKCTNNGKYTGNTGDVYDYYMYTWDKAWCGYAALLAECGYDTNTYVNEMKFELNNMGGLSTSKYATPGYDGWGFSRYNCALQMLATHIADITNDDSYYEASKYQMDYILGNNPTGYSFLIGYSDKYALRYHHRAANPGTGNPADNTESKYVLYGAMIGGCDANGNYLDHQNEFKFTEPALDYNGSFALAIAALADKYGGDSSTIKDIIKNAPEIDENYKFDGEEQPQPSTETTETTGDEKLKGDVNNDGVVNVTDVVCLGRYLVKAELTEDVDTSDFNYDVNDDGKINVFDLVAVRRILIEQ
ncbi:glycoside hydrolase family 9 protein [Porcipelethomonas ammoniilytica]|uniref:glycoside hydrolase family 9 protein n=1 Tax=Porcipelethomonas TaxID=2981643 RepID=UPI0008232803|nr:glycoside hydrolase family 9 protein [Porcipelethomonas ammoniilytica]MCU6719430.1 glycoside hydrolase family 9 protein [Porcipelethomonas ammoniilytica]SCI80489.1 Endoglucanase 1 precursor [uncultured Ruminococcus sp.]